MGLLNNITSLWKNNDPVEERASTFDNSKFLADYGISSMSELRTSVGVEASLKIATVYAAVKVISEAWASLPQKIYKRDGANIEVDKTHNQYKLLSKSPSRLYTAFEFRRSMCSSLLLHGNSYAKIIRNNEDIGIEYDVLNSKNVMPFLVKYSDGTRDVWYKNYDNEELIPSADMIHWKDMGGLIHGTSRITLHGELLGMSKASLDFRNKLYTNGLQLGGTVEYPVESKVTDAQLTDLRRSFETVYGGMAKGHRIGFLNNGGTFKKLDPGMSFADVQHIQSETFTQESILSLFLCPAAKIGLGKDSKYSNLESMLTDFDKNVLTPLCVSWEQETGRKVIPETESDTHYVKCNIDALSRADLKTRSEYLTAAIKSGQMTINEVRALDDRNPVEGGDETLVPVNNVWPLSALSDYMEGWLKKTAGLAKEEKD